MFLMVRTRKETIKYHIRLAIALILKKKTRQLINDALGLL
jgi:hypothetical protein